MKICGIYKIVSPSKKVYIGQSVNIITRWNVYKQYNCKNQPYLYNSLKKYGWEKHKFEILCQCSKEELNNLEIYYIELYQCFDSKFGLNLRTGGANGIFSKQTKDLWSKKRMGRKASDETKKKMSEKSKGHKRHTEYQIKRIKEVNTNRKMSDETKSKIREFAKKNINKIKTNPLKGCKLPENWKRKIVEATKKRWSNPEFKKMMSEKAKNQIISKETRLKMLKSRRKNHKEWHTKETKEKISKTLLNR